MIGKKPLEEVSANNDAVIAEGKAVVGNTPNGVLLFISITTQTGA